MDTSTIATAVEPPVAAGLGSVVPLQFSGNFLELAVLFLIIAIVAAVVGARGVAGISMDVAKWFVVIFVVLAVVSVVL